MTGPLLFPDGTALAPSIAFSSDADGTGTGVYRHGANVLGFSTNGAGQWSLSAIDLSPITDNADDIGTTARRVKHLHTGRIVTGAATPTVAIASGFGTSPSAAVNTGSADAAGIIVVTTGNPSAVTTGSVTVTFSAGNGAYGTNPPVVIITPQDGTGTWDVGVTHKLTAVSTTAFTVALQNGATNFTAASTYLFHYHVIGK